MCIKENIIYIFWNNKAVEFALEFFYICRSASKSSPLLCPLLLSRTRNSRSVNRVQMCPAEFSVHHGSTPEQHTWWFWIYVLIYAHNLVIRLAMFSLCEAKTPNTRNFGRIHQVGRWQHLLVSVIHGNAYWIILVCKRRYGI